MAEITLAFWVMKIIATTLGETTGDFIAQTLNLGYVVGLGITSVLLVGVLTAQIRAERLHPSLFWAAIVATTTAGTEISDLMDRTLGLGYVGGSIVLTMCLLATLFVWHRRVGHLQVDGINRRDTEIMFWVAVVFSNSLGTAFGDFLVDVIGLSYATGALVTMGVIGLVLIAHYTRAMNDVVLFWIAFVFTRPFGATFGDLLTKPAESGGLHLGTYNASIVCILLLSGLIFVSHRRRRRLSARP
ncbi:MAG: hypothetical protein KDD77_16890 [Caldilineaceae bacterium]|nr:hypothetical protein [Caldilineaceae bacterium]